MAAPSLCQELFDEITDSIARDYPKSLDNLSLTSRSHFLERCRFHIFSRLRIEDTAPHGILRILETNPSLLKHVRRLDMYIEAMYPSNKDSQDILQLLDSLTELKTLFLGLFGTADPGLAGLIQPSLVCRSAIDKLFSRPLVNVKIMGYPSFPIHSIHSLPLQSLTIGQSTSFSDGDCGEAQDNWRVRSLECYESSLSTIDNLLKSCSSHMYAHLVNLHLTIETMKGHDNAWRMLKSASQYSRIEWLSLRYNYPSRGNEILVRDCYVNLASSGLTFPPFPHLRCIEIFGSLGPRDRASSITVPDFIPAFIKLLLCAYPQPSLEVVYVGFSWPLPEISLREWLKSSTHFIDDKREWGQIDATLSNLDLFPKLRALRISLSPDYRRGFNFFGSAIGAAEARVREEIMTAFPRALAREGMVFHTGNTHDDFVEIREEVVSAVKQCFEIFN